MAAEEVKPNPELDALFAELAEPFDPSEIKWRVTHTTQDSSRGAVIPFADPRPYTDRLNQIFTPMGWTRSYDVNTVSAVSRMKRDKLIPTGKVLVTCALTIHRLGCHTGGGEEWADEQSAMTRAEAQAFKRACICFGLGRYLYNFAEMWVPVNEHRQPLQIPSLPRWALPSATGTAGKSNPASGPKPPMGPHRSEDNVEDRRVSAHPRLPDIRRNPLAHRACTKSECNTERAAPNRRGRRDGMRDSRHPQSQLPGRRDRRYPIHRSTGPVADPVDHHDPQSWGTQAVSRRTRKVGWATGCMTAALGTAELPVPSAIRRHYVQSTDDST